MSAKDDLVRFRHMLDAAGKAVEFVRGRKRADLDTDEQLMLSLVRLLEVVGEAAKGVSSDLRDRYPSIRWKEIIGTRDRLIHGYFDVDIDIVWQIAANDLPPLIDQLKKALAKEG